MVQIQLNPAKEPQKVTYSYHHGGNPFEWSKIQIDADTHPRLFVTLGGHGVWLNTDNHAWQTSEFKCKNCIDTTVGGKFGRILYPKDVIDQSLLPSGGTIYVPYNIIDFSNENEYRWVRWKGRWGMYSDVLDKAGLAGPKSPANIKYGDAPNRWDDPITWQDDPLPENYKKCESNGENGDDETELTPLPTETPRPTPIPIPPPTANFKANPTSGVVQLTVQFTDLSEPEDGIDDWLWSFGDGDTSSIQNPSHTYKSKGLFTVKLTVSNSSGTDTETKSNHISVEPKPTPTPTPEPSVLSKLTINPTTAKRFSFETATVTALDQNDKPIGRVRGQTLKTEFNWQFRFKHDSIPIWHDPGGYNIKEQYIT